jgi:phosphohistidine phosphatase
MTPRRLILMRHGSADPGHGIDDHERVLTMAGRAEGTRMADQFQTLGWSPDAVRGSDSRRTRQTWDAMADRFGGLSVSWTSTLYLTGLGSLIDDASGWDRGHATVLCLGHNPGWSEAGTGLSGVRVRMGTAFAALLEGEGGDWSEAFTHPWSLVDLLRP